MLDLQNARKALLKGNDTCVLCRGEDLVSSTVRGVAPLLSFLDSDKDFNGFCAADRVVGKGAAFLYVLLGVRAVHAQVISESALAVLQGAQILTTYEQLVPYIKNRAGDAQCPIERAVLHAQNAKAALPLIRARLNELRNR